MNPYLLLLLVGTAAAIMNMVPWAGPLGRTASVLDVDVTELWRPLIQIQVIGLVLLIIIAVALGYREKRLIAKRASTGEDAIDQEISDETIAEAQLAATVAEENDLKRPKLLWINALLAIAVIGVLVSGIIPAGFAFMIGVSIALPLNFPKVQDQMARIKEHAPGGIMMATIILAAGSFLGILNGTNMLNFNCHGSCDSFTGIRCSVFAYHYRCIWSTI